MKIWKKNFEENGVGGIDVGDIDILGAFFFSREEEGWSCFATEQRDS
jgi:hypothetical protein